MAKFAKSLNQKSQEGEWEKGYQMAIFSVEKELHQHIGEDYPLMKFFSQYEALKEYVDEENRRQRLSNMKRR